MTSFSFWISPDQRKLSYSREHYSTLWRDFDFLPPVNPVKIWVVCPDGGPEKLTQVEHRIRDLAATDQRTKAESNLRPALDPITYNGDGTTVGWLELDNGFFFFCDRDMAVGCCEALGVEFHEGDPGIPEPEYSAMKKDRLVKEAVTRGCFLNKTAANKKKKAELIDILTGKIEPTRYDNEVPLSEWSKWRVYPQRYR